MAAGDGPMSGLNDLFPGSGEETVPPTRGPLRSPSTNRTLLYLGACLVAVLLVISAALLIASRPERAAAHPVPAGATGTDAAPAGPPTAGGSGSGASSTALPAGSTDCPGRANGPRKAAIGNTSTSCEFAVAVRDAWVSAKGAEGVKIMLTVLSPVTEQSYDMTCLGHLPIVCVGGSNALVYLY